MSDRTQQIHRRPHRIATPAAGAEFVVQPNTVGHWRILSLIFTLATSAVVANRNVSFSVTDGTTRTFKQVTAANQAAALSFDYTAYAQATPTVVVNNTVVMQLPEGGLWLPKGWSLTSLTANLDVGDQYSGIVLDIQEIPDGPDWTAEPSMPLNVMLLDQ